MGDPASPSVFGSANLIPARAASRPAAPSTSCAAFSAARPTPLPTARAPATTFGSIGCTRVAPVIVFVGPVRFGVVSSMRGCGRDGTSTPRGSQVGWSSETQRVRNIRVSRAGRLTVGAKTEDGRVEEVPDHERLRRAGLAAGVPRLAGLRFVEQAGRNGQDRETRAALEPPLLGIADRFAAP